MTCHGLALIGIAHQRDLSSATALPEGFEPIVCGELIAFAYRQPAPSTGALARKDAARSFLEHQRRLEALWAVTSFLPAQPGVQFETIAELQSFVAGSTDQISGAVEAFSHQEQYQVLVSWHADQMLQRLLETEDGAEVAAKAKAATSRFAAGSLIKAAMEDWRSELGAAMTERLREILGKVEALPLGEAAHVMNAVCLVPRGQSAILEAALEAIDAWHPQCLRIQMIGPLPACSFASIGRGTVKEGEGADALSVLGVSSSAGLDGLRSAWLGLAKVHHPDLGEANHGVMGRLNAAYRTARAFLRERNAPEAVLVSDPVHERRAS